jgi:hypothetical protein
MVGKVHHCRFQIQIDDVKGIREITTSSEDAKAIESEKPFTVSWFPKGRCWIPYIPTLEDAV